jgi:hypothetical protein
MPCHRLPQHRRCAIAASLDAASLDAELSPPSMPMPHRRRLPRCCTVTSLNADVALSLPPSIPRCRLPQRRVLTLSTLLCYVQSAGIVLDVIALFIGLISSMMICGVVRLECDNLRVLVS